MENVGKKEVAEVLGEIGTILEIKGENPFKSRAYANAARVIEALDGDLVETVRAGKLASVKGIGEGLAAKITELVETGRSPYHEELKASVPEGLFDMLAIPGLGPKKVKALWEGLGVTTVGELEYACKENRLLDLPGFGAKSQEKILKGIEQLKAHRSRFLYPEALWAAGGLEKALRARAPAIRISIAGSLRRRKETVKDIDLVASARLEEMAGVGETFARLPEVTEVVVQGETKTTIKLGSGISADLRVVADDEFPFALHHLTGSWEHNNAMRLRAKSRGLKMNEYGVFRGEKRIDCKDEAEIFAALGLSFIPPELREDTGEIEAAAAGTLPVLVEESDLKGTLHVHTNWSDGRAGLEEMVRAAKAKGWQWVGISDHSRSAKYARGLEPERVAEQHRHIAEMNARDPSFTIFHGIESDILGDGSLDYPPEILDKLDFVIGALHSRFNLSREEMTARVVRAMADPHLSVMGHVTGRLLLAREPYEIDLERVIEEAAERGVIMEINANPHRLDLDWRWVRKTRALGCLIAINPDAHEPAGLDDVSYGVGIARKGWLTAADLLNTCSTEDVRTLLAARPKKERASCG